MSDFHKHFLDADTMLALEAEELAGYLLEFYHSITDRNSQRHVMRVEWLESSTGDLEDKYQDYPPRFHEQISRALMEALSWLGQAGLIAPWRAGCYFITRRGSVLKRRVDVEEFRKRAGLPKQILHPVIAEKAWPSFLRGEYETAVFQAFKEVEVAVRTAGSYTPTDLGTDLMRKAFNQTSGPLTDKKEPAAESDPSQSTPGNVAHAHFGKPGPVLPGAPNVGDQQPTARTEHSHRFVDCLLPASTSPDVVNRQTGDNHIKAVVLKRQRRHVPRVQFDTICYPLSDGVAPGGLGGIAGLIGAAPQVYPNCPARGQVLSGHEQDRTTATSQVQDSLVTPKPQPVEQFGPDQELASERAVEVEPENCQHEKSDQKQPHLAGDDCEYELRNGHDGNESRGIGSINPIRTTPSRVRRSSHECPSSQRRARVHVALSVFLAPSHTSSIAASGSGSASR